MGPYDNLMMKTLSLRKYRRRSLRIRMLMKILSVVTTMVKTAQKRCSFHCMLIHHFHMGNGYADLIR